MEMDCYLRNYKDPYRNKFKPSSGKTTTGSMAGMEIGNCRDIYKEDNRIVNVIISDVGVKLA